MSNEFATHAGTYLQEKVPVALEGQCIQWSKLHRLIICSFLAGKEFASKAIEVGQEYGKDAYEKTGKYAGQIYEAGKEKTEELIKATKKKLDL